MRDILMDMLLGAVRAAEGFQQIARSDETMANALSALARDEYEHALIIIKLLENEQIDVENELIDRLYEISNGAKKGA